MNPGTQLDTGSNHLSKKYHIIYLTHAFVTIFQQYTLFLHDLQNPIPMNTACSCFRICILFMYMTAITSQKAITQDYSSTGIVRSAQDEELLIRQADSLVICGRYLQAENLYKTFLNTALPDPLVLRLLADLLRKQGKVSEAQNLYLSLNQFNPTLAARGLAHCTFARGLLAERPSFDIFLLPFNTQTSEFGITFLYGSPSFSSIGNATKQQTTGLIAAGCKALFYSEEKSALVAWTSLINHASVSEYSHISIFGSRAILTKAPARDRHQLFDPAATTMPLLGEVSQTGDLYNITHWPFSDIFSRVHSACLSEDGSLLVFSAKNEENHFDLYISKLSAGGWSNPISAGEPINTEGNEITPYFHQGVLYFSSDTHAGLGGFDIFYSGQLDGLWLPPLNMGSGINSTEDDYYISTDGTGTFYFTSNRLGGKGMNDLYGATRISRNSEIALESKNHLPHHDEPLIGSDKTRIMAKPASYSVLKEKGGRQSPNISEGPDISRGNSIKDNRRRFISEMGNNPSTLPVLRSDAAAIQSEIAPKGAPDMDKSYFVQLMVSMQPDPEDTSFGAVLTFGDLYTFRRVDGMRILLGSFPSETKARGILDKIRKSGFPDAFLISFHNLEEQQVQLVRKGNLNKSIDTSSPGGIYKIRLGAYQNPTGFPIKKVQGLGELETWTKGKWTIFVLSGFRDKEEAMFVLGKVKSTGFVDSQLVREREGMLETVKTE